MTNVFKPIFINGHETLFWIYVVCMLIIILLTIVWVIKEVKNVKNK